jgi:hypothetical protein
LSWPFDSDFYIKLTNLGVLRAVFDDIAIILFSFSARRSAKIIFEAFQMYKKVSGLTTNVAKNVAIPLWDMGDARNLNHTNKLIDTFIGFIIASHGKYLGFYIGPSARENAWSHLVLPFFNSVSEIRAFVLGLTASIWLYNMLCFPKLTFVAQCYTTDSIILKAEARAIQILHAGPRHSPSTIALHCLRQYGAMMQIPSLAIVAKAVMLRATLSTCAVLCNQLCHVSNLNPDECVLIGNRFINDWIAHSLVFQMKNDVIACNQLLGVDYANMDKTHQKNASALLSKTLLPNSLLRFGIVQVNTDIVLANAKKISARLPPFIFTGLLRLWTNGWISKRRFGDATALCLLCHCDGTQDDVRHFFVCKRHFFISSVCIFSTSGSS